MELFSLRPSYLVPCLPTKVTSFESVIIDLFYLFLGLCMKVEVEFARLCPTLRPHGLYSLWNSPGQDTGVGSLFLLQGIFPTQRLNPGLPHYRQSFTR